jgi:hypothetical protein
VESVEPEIRMTGLPFVVALGAGLEDKLADIIAWVAVIIVPVVAIGAFWMVHILPEKFAHKRHHPQTEAIKMLCLMSLFFGGLLWPFAFVWAFTKPVRLQVEAVPTPDQLPVAQETPELKELAVGSRRAV